MKRRGNPNWMKALPVEAYIKPTGYEMLLKKLRIEPKEHDRILRSIAVREYARKFCNTRYVPEWLLDAMGLIVTDEDVYVSRSTDNALYVQKTLARFAQV